VQVAFVPARTLFVDRALQVNTELSSGIPNTSNDTAPCEKAVPFAKVPVTIKTLPAFGGAVKSKENDLPLLCVFN